MGGICTDYSASPSLGAGASAALPENLCGIRRGAYMGLVTYNDGRVVRIVPESDPQNPHVRQRTLMKNGQQVTLYEVDVFRTPQISGTQELVTLTNLSEYQLNMIRGLQQTEIGVCYNNGPSLQVQIPKLANGAQPISWTPAQERGLLSLFANQPDHVYFCIDAPTQGVIGFNTSSEVVRKALSNLRTNCATVLGDESTAQCQALQNGEEASPPAPRTCSLSLIEAAVIFVVVDLLGIAIAEWIKNRGGPTKPDGGDKNASAQTTKQPAKTTPSLRDPDTNAMTNAAAKTLLVGGGALLLWKASKVLPGSARALLAAGAAALVFMSEEGKANASTGKSAEKAADVGVTNLVHGLLGEGHETDACTDTPPEKRKARNCSN